MSNPTASTLDAEPNDGGLKENFSQQQAKITALKELVRQTEASQGKRTANAQEKAKNIAQRLTHLKSKQTRAKHGDKSLSELNEESSSFAATQHAATHSVESTTTIITTDEAIVYDEISTHIASTQRTLQRAESLPAHEFIKQQHHQQHQRAETPGSEKIQLLRRQMEQNRARMAEREHSKRDIEQMVTQLKAKFDSSQMSLDRSASVSNLGRSVGDLSLDHTSTKHALLQRQHRRQQHQHQQRHEQHSSADGDTAGGGSDNRFQSSVELSAVGGGVGHAEAAAHSFDRERCRYLEQRCAALERQAQEREAAKPAAELEAQIIELHEQLRVKDSLIEARTQAVGVVSEMGRSAEDELEDTRNEWQASQRRFADAEDEWRGQLDAQAARIASLEQANEILETARFELTVQQAVAGGNDDGPTTAAELHEMQQRIDELESELEASRDKLQKHQTAEVDTVVELRVRIDELTATVQRLERENETLLAKEQNTGDDGSFAKRLAALQADNERLDAALQEKSTEYSVLSANCAVLEAKLRSAAPKSLFSVGATSDGDATGDTESTAADAGEVSRLRQQLDDANKSAIKTKLKQKQLQKQIDAMRKTDETARKIGDLMTANEELQQRVRELAGRLETGATGGGDDRVSTDRLAVLETTCHNQIEAIRLLEEQKIELSEELASLKTVDSSTDQLDRSAQAVATHMEAIASEEKLDSYRAQIAQLQQQLAAGAAERSALNVKLNHYVAENMELIDRWDKQNTGSSAESIEIVEKLTASERLEMEAIERRAVGRSPAVNDDCDDEDDEAATLSSTTTTGTLSTVVAAAATAEDVIEDPEAQSTDSSAMSQDLSDSLVRLRVESSELMERIEAFTEERREVMAKMERLQEENDRLSAEIEEVRRVGERLSEEREEKAGECERLTESLRMATEELEVSAAQSSTKVEIRTESAADVEFSAEVYEKSLRAVEALLEGYRRGKDKNAKFEVSKKLAKEVKNTVDVVQKLIGEHVELVARVNELKSRSHSEPISSEASQLPSAETVARITQLESALAALQQSLDAANDRLKSAVEERQILQKLVAEQKDQLIDTITDFQQTVDEQTAEIERLQKQSSNTASGHEQYANELNQKMLALKQLFDENNAELERQAGELVNRQETIGTLDAQLRELYANMEVQAGQLAAKEDELMYLQEIIDTSRETENTLNERWKKSEGERQRLEESLAEQLRIVRVLEDKAKATEKVEEQKQQSQDSGEHELSALGEKIADLEARNHEQLEKLKKFAANLKKKNAQCVELSERVAQLEKSEQRLVDFEAMLQQQQNDLKEKTEEIERLQANKEDSNRIAELVEELADRKLEIKKHNKQFIEFECKLQQLQKELGEKTAKIDRLRDNNEDTNRIAELVEELAERNLELNEVRHQLSQTEHANNDLTKQIAGILSEKTMLTANIAQLETQLVDFTAQISQQSHELAAVRGELQTRIAADTEHQELHRIKIEKCKTIIRDKNRELQRLNDRVAELAAQPPQPSPDSQLNQQQQLKLAEHEHFIEQLLGEKADLQTRVSELGEQLSRTEHRIDELTAAAAESATNVEQQAQQAATVEHDLQHQLQASAQEIAAVRDQLTAAVAERDELQTSLQDSQATITTLTQRAHENHSRAEAAAHELHTLRAETATTADELNRLHDELRHQRTEAAAQLAAKHAEIDTLENELSLQLQTLDTQRRQLQEESDRRRDTNDELLAESVRLKEIVTSLEQSNTELEREAGWLRLQNDGMQQDQVEVQELRMQIVHDQTEIENLQAQSLVVVQQHDAEVAALRTQLTELDSLRTQIGQNQTDDQMCIQHENERLQSRLAAVEAELMAALVAASPSSVASSSAAAAAVAVVASSGSSDSEKLLLREQIVALQSRQTEWEAERRRHELEVGQLETLRQQCADVQQLNGELESAVGELRARAEKEHQRNMQLLQQETEAVLEEAAVQQRVTESAATPVQPAMAATVAAQRSDDVAHLEQYINDLQIQLRIATNDCEQLAMTQQSLEEEIQRRTFGYEQQIGELQRQLVQHQQQPQPLEEQQFQQHHVQHQQQQPPPQPEFDLSALESLIIPSTSSAIVAPNVATATVPSFDSSLFFGPPTTVSLFDAPPSGDAPHAVATEPPIVPKTTYLCHEGSDADDGWGFGSDEAALEEQHQQQQQQQHAAVPAASAQQLLVVQQTLERQIADLTAELDTLRAEHSAGQQKAVKMMRKLKEYKARNDELTADQSTFRKSSSVESTTTDLVDLAIQEELNAQVRQLELKLREQRTEQDKEQAERQSLLKRCDVLAAANERLTEMKERQDLDMEACRLRLRQVEQQLVEMHQWQEDDDGGVDDRKKRDTKDAKVESSGAEGTEERSAGVDPRELEELRRQCADLQTDNAELQAIVDNEKDQTSLLESRILHLTNLTANAHDECDANIAALQNRNQSLDAQVAQLSGRLSESVATIDTLSGESNNIRTHLDQLRTEHEQKIEENRQLAAQFRAMSDQLTAMKSSLLDSQQQQEKTEPPAASIASSSSDLRDLESRCELLSETLQCREAEVAHLNQLIAEANTLRDRLASDEQQHSAAKAELRSQIDALQLQLEHERQQQQQQQQQQPEPATEPADPLEATVNQLASQQLAELLADKQQMEHELAVLNDQVLGSLQLEDDMRSMRMEMDAKNIEISELKASVGRMTAALHESELRQQQAEHPIECTASLEAHTKQLNGHWELVLEQRCAELAESWRQHLAAREDEFAEQLARHSGGPATVVATSQTSPERKVLATPAKGAADGAVDVDGMRAALEAQEVEIVTLKEQLAIRSAEYARLASQVDPFGTKSKTTTAAAPTNKRRDVNRKSELDLTMYMLHQRDMRCEELTEELMSMLEERDSLQMKLAGSMRQIERLRVVAVEATGVDPLTNDTADVTPEKQSPASDSSDQSPSTSTTSPSAAHTTTATTSAPSRSRKLRDEREQRQRQMAILQRDVATLPPEALAELMGIDYDESDTSADSSGGGGGAQHAAERVGSTLRMDDAAEESPYTALMNLFWGPRAPATNDS